MTRGAGRKTQKRGAFGTAHKLPSGRYRAMYRGPDGRRHAAPKTFLTEGGLRHSTVNAALRYQHVAAGRDQAIARRCRKWS